MIKQLRQQHGMDEDAFANFLGVSGRTVRKWEEGEAPEYIKWFATETYKIMQEVGEETYVHMPRPENPIRALRYELNLSRKDFAKKIGVSSTTIGKWEKGEAPSQVERLASDLLYMMHFYIYCALK